MAAVGTGFDLKSGGRHLAQERINGDVTLRLLVHTEAKVSDCETNAQPALARVAR
jgi:hypothetical protein